MTTSRDIIRHKDLVISGRTALQLRMMLPVCLGLIALSAEATTEAEDKIRKMPMPHEALGTSGPMVKVHRARLDGYLEGKPGNADRLVQLQAQVQACLQMGKAGGAPVNPPRAWPDFIYSQRTDEYSSANRSIRYSAGLLYAVNPVDCSLLEVQRVVAKLSSSNGSCDIDLLKKTARGVCDATAHADALPPVRTSVSTLGDVEAAQKKAPNNPALTALARAMRPHPPGGMGVRKTILGIECEVWKNSFDPEGTVCRSRGGSFVAAHVAGEQTDSSIALEMTSVAGIKMQAVDAKLDTLVNAAVFAPYLAGGFDITNTRARK